MHSKYLVAAAIGFTVVSTPVAALAADSYGAIGYSQQSGYNSWATDYTTEQAAEDAAMNECYKGANDCKLVLWWKNGCGALAVGSDGGWGTNYADNYRQAQIAAIEQCSKVSQGCQTIVTKCISGY